MYAGFALSGRLDSIFIAYIVNRLIRIKLLTPHALFRSQRSSDNENQNVSSVDYIILVYEFKVFPQLVYEKDVIYRSSLQGVLFH